MTFEEAKKILEKEFAVISLHKSTEPFEFDESKWFKHEKPSVLEAFRVLSKEGYYITISGHDYDMRKKRLEKEYEENNKAPGSAENNIKEDSVVNPALKEAASQFNDALLDEQAKKIEELTKEKELLEDKITIFNIFKKRNDKAYQRQIRSLDKEISDLGKELAATKKALEEKTKLVEIVRNGSKEYCDYGVAANEFIKELAHLYVLASNNGNINGEMLERCKNYQTYGFPANCNRETKKEINDIARGKTKVVGVDIAEEGEDYYGKIVLCDKICTRKIEEIEIEKAVKLVRKAMKEGHTVTINYKD